MKRSLFSLLVLLALLSGFLVRTTRVAHAATSSCVNPNGTNVLQGTLGGASYIIAVPSNWNGTLVLYSHGYVFPGQPNLAPTAALTGVFGAAFLQQGYALAGSSYSQTGWVVQQAFHDQITLLDYFDATCGTPTRTIAMGHSEGGLISAGLVQLYPNRFAGALPMCGALAGGIGNWNEGLDSAFAIDVLLAGNTLPLVHVPALGSPALTTAFDQAEAVLQSAQGTTQGRARLALVAALDDLPGWIDSFSPEPASTDYTTQEQNQFLLESQVLAYAFFGRADLELRASGNPSWNTGVNYHVQLAKSADNEEVQALYQQAGLNLGNDLDTLNAAPRISADPGAVGYLNQYFTLNGNLSVPVLTMVTVGDRLVENEQAYASAVHASGETSLLRQVYVHRAGHCTFTPAETLTAFQTLIHRLDSGKWEDSTNPDLMNQEAAALGPNLNVLPSPFPNGTTLIPIAPAFFNFQPSLFLRPYPSNGSQ
jgi:pimeloyl-ACP methyl ester carboxylesterase